MTTTDTRSMCWSQYPPLPMYHSPQSMYKFHLGHNCQSWGAQEEWRRMGFRGEFQGTGQLQDALQQRDNSMQDSDAVQGMPRGRCRSCYTCLAPCSCTHLLCNYPSVVQSLVCWALTYLLCSHPSVVQLCAHLLCNYPSVCIVQ